MLSNYFTLRHIALDLHASLAGSLLRSAFSQSRNELVITFDNDVALITSCEPSNNALYLRHSFPRARRNSLDFFHGVWGKKVLSAAIQPADREILISLEGDRFIHFRLFGPKANVVLADSHRKVHEAFLHPRETTGQFLEPPHNPIRPLSGEEFEAKFRAIGHVQAFAVLKTMFPLHGSVLIRELFHRSGISEHQSVSGIQSTEIVRLHESWHVIESELMSPSPRTYLENDHPALFALIALHSFAHLASERFESIHEAIEAFLKRSRRARNVLGEKTGLERKLSAELERLERTIGKMADETAAAGRAARYELCGKLLKAHLHLLNKGMRSIVLENIFSPTKEEHEIPLDQHLTGARNADRYFARAKKAKHALEEAISRKQTLHIRFEIVKDLLELLRPIQTTGGWETFLQDHGTQLAQIGFGNIGGSQPKQPPPFRQFTVEGGFQVWAGKDSRNNDLLTLKHARPNDLWFHARGAGGSHVVLRMGSGKGEVSRKAIHQAAAIAAYYSKMKSSKLVPVAMTHRKYVRKPRGSPAGTVVLEREKVLMVEPGLPGDPGHRP